MPHARACTLSEAASYLIIPYHTESVGAGHRPRTDAPQRKRRANALAYIIPDSWDKDLSSAALVNRSNKLSTALHKLAFKMDVRTAHKRGSDILRQLIHHSCTLYPGSAACCRHPLLPCCALRITWLAKLQFDNPCKQGDDGQDRASQLRRRYAATTRQPPAGHNSQNKTGAHWRMHSIGRSRQRL
jgi:hypothetical protein